MHFLSAERAELDRFLPGFDDRLARLGLDGAEDPRSAVIREFRDAGGGNLLLPAELGGMGATAVQAVRVQRALGSRAPSLAVATTMHQYKAAWLADVLTDPKARALLRDVAAQRMLIASCGAESGVASNLFTPGVTVRAVEGGLAVSGVKRPCSLVWSMGVLSMMVAAPDDSPWAGQLLNILAPAESPGIQARSFWKSPIFAAAQTDEVTLQDVFVPEHHVIPLGPADNAAGQTVRAFVWFVLLITTAYVGVASALAETVLERRRGSAADRVLVVGALEGAAAAVEGVAALADTGAMDEALLARALFARYAAQRAITESTDRAAELLGGSDFASGARTAHLLAASRALVHHPLAEAGMREQLDTFLSTGELALT